MIDLSFAAIASERASRMAIECAGRMLMGKPSNSIRGVSRSRAWAQEEKRIKIPCGHVGFFNAIRGGPGPRYSI